MIIAVASGKGGTGKTTLATSLSLAWGCGQFLDCDVEEPNAHFFMKPLLRHWEKVTLPVPHVSPTLCTYCGECARFCQFHALTVIRRSVTVFETLCHGCGGCARICPEKAILEEPREVGVIEKGLATTAIGQFNGSIQFFGGRLHPGENATSTVIRALKKYLEPNGLAILDAPPGNACPLVTTVEGSDYGLLVTEPTPFGLHDLQGCVAVLRELGIPYGVVINRDGTGYLGVENFCQQEGIPILWRIPDDRGIAEAYARGDPLLRARPEYAELLLGLLREVTQQIEKVRRGEKKGEASRHR